MFSSVVYNGEVWQAIMTNLYQNYSCLLFFYLYNSLVLGETVNLLIEIFISAVVDLDCVAYNIDKYLDLN